MISAIAALSIFDTVLFIGLDTHLRDTVSSNRSPVEVRIVALVSHRMTVGSVDHPYLIEPFQVVAGSLGIAVSEVSEVSDVRYLRGDSNPGYDVEKSITDRPARE